MRHLSRTSEPGADGLENLVAHSSQANVYGGVEQDNAWAKIDRPVGKGQVRKFWSLERCCDCLGKELCLPRLCLVAKG